MRKALRFEVLRRDGYSCVYCGAKASPDTQLEVDHVVPTSLGGHDVASNLVTACTDCNRGKAGRTLDEDFVDQVDEDAARWAAAMAQAQRESADDYRQRQELGSEFLAVWKACGHDTLPGPDYRDTVLRFITNGLSKYDIVELVTVARNANARDPWLYFCGCCHTRLRQHQERAAQILREGDFYGED